MSLDFVAVDFETANGSHASVCAVGAVRVRKGRVVAVFSTIVRPPEGYDEFMPGNVRVHGITAAAAATSPGWPAAYRSLRDFIGDDVVVGHNAAFDVSVMLNACSACDIGFPSLQSLCTLQLSRAALSIPSYSLPWVSTHLGLPPFDHHDPLADARASALVLVALAQLADTTSLAAIAERFRVPLVPTWSERDDVLVGELFASHDDIVGTGFAGEVVCFTGALKLMVRDRARELVVEQGGTWQASVTRTTTLLVTGDFNEQTFRPGSVFSSKLEKAFAQIEAGQALEILTEEAFITRMTISEQELRARLGARAARSKLPDWVLPQSGTGPSSDFWLWYRTALAHPHGRARGGEPCIWCGAGVPATTHWIHRDRHVCGIHCNERLKRSAARAWRREGLLSSLPDDTS